MVFDIDGVLMEPGFPQMLRSELGVPAEKSAAFFVAAVQADGWQAAMYRAGNDVDVLARSCVERPTKCNTLPVAVA